MRVYALVGGTGAGKSTVSRLLARRFGGATIDVDRIGHRLLHTARVRRQLLDRFGPGIVGQDGRIDRRRLGQAVFGKPVALRALNAIVHPEIARLLRGRVERLSERGLPFVLLDAALFFEFDPGFEVDGVLAVHAPRSVRRKRLLAKRGLTENEVDARLGSQPRLRSWIHRADVRLDTDCTRSELVQRAERAFRALGSVRRRPQGEP